MRDTLSDYTRQELKELIVSIEEAETEDELGSLVDHFNKIVPHPAGSDLLFYPEAGADESPDGIVRTIDAYCVLNGMHRFKDS
ncbi:bacteriocin immunity protein [Pseudomonas allokribbensis]|uniref:bacteriocin immunity protein n=1 Tax=Pseudomonas allokribbensis TaxID=2774460 RepID=UPI00178835B0|nr:bacteriocin immunity protein [Pseudomonas allokribbensis]